MFVTLAFWLVLILYVINCGLLVVVILSQEGSKGGGLTGGLGTTAGETFGFSSATETFRRFTRILATIFVVLSIVLTYLGNQMVSRGASRFVGTAVATPAPAVPAVTAEVPAATDAQPEPAQAQPTAEVPVATQPQPASQPAPAPVESAPVAVNTAAIDATTTN